MQMRLGMLNNENLEQLIKRIRGTAANDFTDGIMQLSRAQAETLVRTSIINTTNMARLEMFSRDPGGLMRGIKWLTAKDERVDDPCADLANKEWKVPDDPKDFSAYKPIGHKMKFPGPTEHWNCRCIQVPVMKSLEELAAGK